MCLTNVHFYEDHLPEAAIGYKVVIKTRDGRYTPWVRTPSVIRAALLGCGWAIGDRAAIIRDESPFGRPYLPGVHAYADEYDARDARYRDMQYYLAIGLDTVVVKVLLRGPIAAGNEGSRQVLVYKEMTVLEELDSRIVDMLRPRWR